MAVATQTETINGRAVVKMSTAQYNILPSGFRRRCDGHYQVLIGKEWRVVTWIK